MSRVWVNKKRRLVKKIVASGIVNEEMIERIKERVFFDDGEGSWVDGNGKFIERVDGEVKKHWRTVRKENLEKLMKRVPGEG